MTDPRRAAVVGAGVMGSGIAAHLANAGLEVALLDAVPGAAQRALERLPRSDPPALVSRSAARRIRAGDVPGDLGLVADADWIVEAVVEDAAVKRALFAGLDDVRRPGSIVSSNTSTIPLAELAEDASPELAADLLVAHFFNPPRYLRLLELVAGPATRPDAVDAIEALGDVALGKAVVRCADTPGFVGNRLGAYWIGCALGEAVRRGLAIEDADAAIARAFGAPRTGIFALLDLVGLDLMLAVDGSLVARLPADDPYQALDRRTDVVERLVAAGRTGRKGDGGFYRREGADRFALDLQTGGYRPRGTPGRSPEAAAYAADVLAATLAYAEHLVPAVATAEAVDTAMEAGYGWARGPFALAGRPPAPTRVRGRLRDLRQDREPVARNAAAALWDTGDGVACLEFTSHVNALDTDTMALIVDAVGRVAADFRALVVHNEGEHFSVGANLGAVLLAANVAAWDALDLAVRAGQGAYAALERAPFPVVGAPSGRALGGGCEVLLHCDAIQAHVETYCGLVEVGVGVVPAWGGCTKLLARLAARTRLGGPLPPVVEAFETIGLAKVARSAHEARELGFLREGDGITMNRDRVLGDARALALELADGYRPPDPVELPLPGRSGYAALMLAVDALVLRGAASAHDRLVASHLATVLTGGPDADPLRPTTEKTLRDLERTAFLALARTEPTLLRMEHILATGRPLRN